MPAEHAPQALHALQLLSVGVLVPPPQVPLHCTVSPEVQALPSLQAVPVLAAQEEQLALLEQELVQEEILFATLTHALLWQIVWVPLTLLVQ